MSFCNQLYIEYHYNVITINMAANVSDGSITLCNTSTLHLGESDANYNAVSSDVDSKVSFFSSCVS